MFLVFAVAAAGLAYVAHNDHVKNYGTPDSRSARVNARIASRASS